MAWSSSSGPERGGDVELGADALPEQEVGDAGLARRADHEVDRRELRRVEVAADGVLVDDVGLLASDRTRRMDELLPAAVVERHGEVETGVVGREAGRLLDLAPHDGGDA